MAMDILEDHPILRSLLGTVVLALGVAVVVFGGWLLVQDLTIWVFGREAEAEVVDRWVEQIGDDTEGDLQFNYFLEYRFQTRDGQTISKRTTVSVSEWAAGDEEAGGIDIVYFPLFPQHNRLNDSRFVPALACSYLPAVVVAAALLVIGWQLLGPAFASRAGAGGGGTRRAEREGMPGGERSSTSHSQNG